MSQSESSSVERLFTEAPRRSRTYRLNVSASDPLTEAFVIDGSLELVGRGQGKLSLNLAKGTYLVKFRSGDNVTQQYVDLSKNLTVTPETKPVPTTSSPVADEAGWSSSEKKAARRFIRSLNLAVIVRDPDERITPADDISIRSIDNQRPIVKLRSRRPDKIVTGPNKSSWKVMRDKPVVGLGGKCEPGGYLLRVATPGIGTVEMTVWVAKGYLTRVYVTREIATAWKTKRKTAHLRTCSVQIVRDDDDTPRNARLAELTEIMRSALVNERKLLLSREIVEALWGKKEHPMLALLAAYCLHMRLQEPDTGQPKDRLATVDLMKVAIRNLARILPGSPDVGALARFYDVAIEPVDFGKPPMLYQAWSLIAPGADRDLIPASSYSGRIAAGITACRPWLVWDVDKALSVPERNDKFKLSEIAKLRKKLRGVTSRNQIAQTLISSAIQKIESSEEIARTMGIPLSTLEESVRQSDPV